MGWEWPEESEVKLIREPTMAITGETKTRYQRDYMRRYRAKKGNSALSSPKTASQNTPGCLVVDELKSVRPNVSPVRPADSVRPKGVSEYQWAYIQMRAERDEHT